MANNSLTLSPMKKRTLAWLLACGGVLLCSFILITPRWAANLFSRLQVTQGRQAAPQPLLIGAPGLQGNAASQVKGIRFTIHPTGIDPKEIVLEPGRYRIAVDNRSGASEANIQLDRSVGNVLVNTQISARKLNWRGVFQLVPGEYNLRLVGQTARTAKITVKNN